MHCAAKKTVQLVQCRRDAGGALAIREGEPGSLAGRTMAGGDVKEHA